MEKNRIPRQGEIYQHFKDRPYQIVAIATHTETGEIMVVYQALYGDFKTYVRPLDMFMSEVDKEKYPDVKQERRFELREEIAKPEVTPAANATNEVTFADTNIKDDMQNTAQMPQEQFKTDGQAVSPVTPEAPEEKVNHILLEFLDAESYNKKLEVISSNLKHMNDRLINDMAVSLDCTVEEGPLEKRIQELLFCLKAMCRFEDKRLR